MREDLAQKTERRMAVMDPIKLVIDNYPAGQSEVLQTENGSDEAHGTRGITFSRELFIQREDFMIDPPKKFFRLFVGGEVRLKSAYIVRCTGYETDENGVVTTVHCDYDPETKSGGAGAERKVKGTLHWVDAQNASPAEFRLYDYLLDEREGEGLDFSERVNPDSLIVKTGYIERALDTAAVGDSFQFIRVGYFRKDEDSAEIPVFNRIVGLRDSWAKQKQ